MQNADVVKRIYEAFGQGDLPSILEHLAEDVEWEYGTASTGVPWLRPLRGRAEVPRFFESLGALEIRQFEPHTFLTSGDTVVALVNFEAVAKATGARIREEDEAHIWHFRNGKVSRFRHCVDTHQHLQASRGERESATPLA